MRIPSPTSTLALLAGLVAGAACDTPAPSSAPAAPDRGAAGRDAAAAATGPTPVPVDAAALAAAPAPAPPLPTTLPDLVLEPTAALIADADLADAVDRLAAARSYEGRFVGFAGKPSPTWAQWQQIAQRASHDDLVALLRHEAPVVRTYAAYHVVDALAADLAAVMPLFRDRTEVETVDGCFIDKASLAQLLVDDLCHRRATPGAAEVLRVVAAAATPTALEISALRCAAALGAPGADDVARGWLGAKVPPDAAAAARDVLAAADPTSP